MVDKLRELFDRPLVLFDTSYKVLATSYDADSVFHFAEGENGRHYMSADAVSFIRANDITEAVRTRFPLVI